MVATADDTAQKLVIPAGGSWSGKIGHGETLTIIDLEGRQGVDFLCYAAGNTEERYHAANTLKKSGTLKLTKGHTLYSDVARPMMSIVADSCGWHDTIAGCCSVPSNKMLYGAAGTVGCRENFLRELAKWGMGRKDIVANLNFFCNVPVGQDNALDPLTFVGTPSKAGDFITLRAEMDVIGVISNCPQINNPCSGGKPTPIAIAITRAASSAPA